MQLDETTFEHTEESAMSHVAMYMEEAVVAMVEASMIVLVSLEALTEVVVAYDVMEAVAAVLTKATKILPLLIVGFK